MGFSSIKVKGDGSQVVIPEVDACAPCYVDKRDNWGHLQWNGDGGYKSMRRNEVDTVEQKLGEKSMAGKPHEFKPSVFFIVHPEHFADPVLPRHFFS